MSRRGPVQRFILERFFLPVALALSVGVFLTVRQLGGNLELAVVGPSMLILAAAGFAERRMPYRRDWTMDRGDQRTDITSAAVLFAVIDPLLKWLLPILLLALVGARVAETGATIFPTGWTFVGQVLLAALLAEFTGYWSHRLHHKLPSLWWLHAMHHGSERLYWLNNFRIHPLNHAINQVLGFAPLWLIGTPPDVVLGYLALTYPVLMLQHANLPLRSGWLNYVFSTNEVHRWHHADNPKEGDRNFGRAFVIWDMVFGTYRYDAKGNDPIAVGLYQPTKYPAQSSFVRQLLSMFSPGCCRAAV